MNWGLTHLSGSNAGFITVTVCLHYLPAYCGGRQQVQAVFPKGIKLDAALEKLGIPCGAVGLAVINGRALKYEDRLSGGEVLHLYAIVAGG